MTDDPTVMLSPQRNVAFAVNYEISIHSWSTDGRVIPGRNSNPPKKATFSVAPPVQSTTTTTDKTITAKSGSSADKFPSASPAAKDSNLATTTTTTTTNNSSNSSNMDKPKSVEFSVQDNGGDSSVLKRRSSRETKKPQVPVERTRVRYDMDQVPAVKRNQEFLDKFPLWTTPSVTRENQILALQMQQRHIIKQHQQNLKAIERKQQRLMKQQQQQAMEKSKAQPLVEQKQTGKQPKIHHPGMSSLDAGSSSDVENYTETVNADENTIADCLNDDRGDDVSPFGEDTSVIWVPKKRDDWEDCVLEMTAVCTSASMRRYLSSNQRSLPSKPFQPPLSKEYIKDRVDIDDPLNGYQIRHKTGGWMQGFILWTNFTVWTQFFKWDSGHPMSGIPSMNGKLVETVDANGSVAAKLELQPRSGNPLEGGVVFDGVAEISLVGGLGCGEYLLRMALDSIRATRKYKFVVLQATNESKVFYERFGFVRVGAVCRYERQDTSAPTEKAAARPGTPIMGYRHWTHPNESDTSLQMHGGPSYMMCLTLPEDDPNEPIETPFLDAMMKLEVAEKPLIKQLGGSSTPYPSKNRRGSVDSTCSVSSFDAQFGESGGPKKKISSKGRRGGSGSPRTVTATSLRQTFDSKIPPDIPILGSSSFQGRNANQLKNNENASGTKRIFSSSSEKPSSKKRRVSGSTAATSADTSNRKLVRDRSKPISPPTKNGTILKKTKVSSNRANLRRSSDQVAATTTKASASFTPAPAPTSSSAARNPTPSRPGVVVKQKVKSYPRDRPHFFNKVVRPKKGKKTENYFVLHYDEDKNTIRIVPMVARDVLSGKRAGRPRFVAMMENYPRNAKTVSCDSYDVVPAVMVMKTPIVSSEAWDVLDA